MSSWGSIPQALHARVASSVILLSAVNTSVVRALCFFGGDFSENKVRRAK